MAPADSYYRTLDGIGCYAARGNNQGKRGQQATNVALANAWHNVAVQYERLVEKKLSYLCGTALIPIFYKVML
jgi:hypothetical protein